MGAEMSAQFQSPRCQSLVELLQTRAGESPQTIAYTFLEQGERVRETLTYGELERRARGIAALLQQSGAAGERALLLYPPGLDFVAAFLGCLYAGTVAVPGYPPRSRRGLPRLQSIMQDARPHCALSDTETLAKLQSFSSKATALDGVRWISTNDLDPGLADTWTDPGVDGDALAFLQYTSGSTSAPKGVMVSHGNLLHNEGMIQRVFDQSEQSMIVGWLPLYHDMGLIGNVLQPLYLGGSCVLMSPLDFLQRPRRWLEAISRYRATTSGGPNFAYELCVHKIPEDQRSGLDLSSWKVAFNGAEPIRATTLERFAMAFEPQGFNRRAFLPCYGLAEGTLLVTGKPAGASPRTGSFHAASLEEGRAQVQGANGDEAARELVACGSLPPEQWLEIVDAETRQPLPPGAVGEIWVSGPSVAKGYWNRPEQTAETFQARLQVADGEGDRPESNGPYLRTGDLGFLDGGSLFVTGRLKDLIIIRGKNHYPQDIELSAEVSHESLRPGCGAAFSVDVHGEERLVLVQEIRREAMGDDLVPVEEAIRRAIAEGHELDPHEVVLVRPGGVPKTSSGKIQRRGCRQDYLAGDLKLARRQQDPNGSSQREISGAAGEPELEIPALTRQDFQSLSSTARVQLLAAYLRQEAGRSMRTPAASLHRDHSLVLDSLAALELKSRLEESLDIELPLPLFFETPTLGELQQAVTVELESGTRRSAIPATAEEPPRSFPLSAGQRAFWFLDRLSPDSAAYHVSFVARMSQGEPLRFSRALQKVVDRHPSLRVVFSPENGPPVQRVQDAVKLPFREVPAEGWTEGELRQRISEEIERPFDLTAGPLLRLTAFRRFGGPILVLVAHHIVTDLWSLVLLAEELNQILPALDRGAIPDLPQRRLQYSDFVAWQQEMLAGPEGKRLWEYWQETLRGAPKALELPTDHPRQPTGASRGASVSVRFDGAMTERLQAASTAAGTTPFVVLVAAYHIFLSRVTGQAEVLVGSPSTGRSRGGLEDVVGYLVNTLVLRGSTGDDPSVLDHMQRTGATVRGALAHQDFPYPLLVERLRPLREGGASPLVQAFITLEKPHRHDFADLAAFTLGQQGATLSLGGPAALGGIELESVVVEKTAVQFELEMVLAETADGLAGVLHYGAELFDTTTAMRFAAHFRTLLDSLLLNPQKRLSHLRLLTSPERQQMLFEWNGSPAEERAVTFTALFAARAAVMAEAPAILFEDGDGAQPTVITYGELAAASDALAQRLHRLGARPDELVAVAVPRSAHWAVAFLAIQKAGACFLPLDPSYPQDRLDYMVEDSGVRLVVTIDSVARQLGLAEGGDGPRPVLLDGPQETAGSGRQTWTPPGPCNAAYAIYTSGSTGRPKGAILTHAGLVNLALAQAKAFAVEPGSRVLQFAALSFDASISELAMAVAGGGALCISTSPDLMPGPGLAGLLQRLAISHVTLPPSSLAALPSAELPALETLICAGETLPAGIVQRWAGDRRVFNAYGPTEATVCSTLVPCLPGEAKPSIGSPLGNVRCYVVDRSIQLCSTGVPGELYVGGVSLARGYHNRPALTAERFVPDPSSGTLGGRLYRTGDLARWRHDGRLEFLGRLDHQIKVRGFRVEPGEVEDALLAHPGVGAAVVVARLDGSGGGRLVGYFVATSEPAPSSQDLRDHLRRNLPESMVPHVVMQLAELPTTPSGKVDRQALPNPSTPRSEEGAMPRSALEMAVSEIWKDVLDLPDVGVDDNFFDLGGHSLLVAQVHQRLKGVFAREVSMVDLFRFPTIRDLVAHASGGGDGRAVAAGSSRAETRLQALAGGRDGAIAIVGMACRFPGASDPEAFWNNLRDGVEAVATLDEEDLLAAGVPEALRADPSYVRAAVPLADIDAFDNVYFGYTPKEAESMDPQHRIFLETAVEALENAGCDPDSFAGSIGVFAGAGLESYMMRLVAGGLSPAAAYQLTIGNLKDFLASRLSYKLNLSGPSIAVQTACSTSLVAVHMACQSLRLGESDVVLAGGASVEIPQRAGYQYQEGMILSPDGHCRPFDEKARGTVRGSGVGVVVLKRLDDALAAGDRIRAIIRGSAVNNDGSMKAGYTAPSVERQAEVITEALVVAGVGPESIGYVEAHGTGTEMGDPIEIEALNTAYAALAEAAGGACAVGSVKSNVGHLDAAAGVAGLIKTVLALEKKEIPPSLNFERANSRIDFAGGPFYVNTSLRPWSDSAGPRRAGVSSFGIGGTNAHVILEEAPAAAAAAGTSRDFQLLPLSARSPAALERAADRLREFLAKPATALDGDASLADVAFTLQTGRRALEHRRLIVTRSRNDAVQRLSAPDAEGVFDGVVGNLDRKIAFLFPGQGAQHPNMGRGLYASEEVFRETVDRCCELLKPEIGLDLRQLLFPGLSLGPTFGPDAEPDREMGIEELREAAAALQQTRFAQPALFVVEVAMAHLWESWGVKADAMLGHSIGELVAATLADVFRLEDALKVVAARGLLMQQMASGSMLSVAVGAEELESWLPADVSLAAVNAPQSSVASGQCQAIRELAATLEEKGVSSRLLVTSHAFHSKMMEPAAAAFRQVLDGIEMRPPSRPYLSNVSGTWILAEEATDPEYWARHLRHPVRFADGVGELLAESGRVLLEVGPGEGLSSLARRYPGRQQQQLALASMPHPKEGSRDVETALTTLGRLWLAGAPVSWQKFSAQETRGKVSLPPYPFQKTRFWAQGPQRLETPANLGPRPVQDWFFQPFWKPSAPASGVTKSGERWLLFADEQGLAPAVGKALQAAGCSLVTASVGDCFAKVGPTAFTLRPGVTEDFRSLVAELGVNGGLPQRIVFAWTLTEEGASPETLLEVGYFSLVALAKAFGAQMPTDPIPLTVVASGVQKVRGGEAVIAEKAAVVGLCRVISQELRHLRCRLLDVELPARSQGFEGLASRVLANAAEATGEPLVALRQGMRLVQDHAAVPLRTARYPLADHPTAEAAVVLITGGLGGLGSAVARHLAETCKARLVLVSRSPVPRGGEPSEAEDEGSSSNFAKLRLLRDLEKAGSETLVLSADVSDPAAMVEAVALAKKRFGRIDGVVHAAGVAGGGVIHGRSRAEAEAVLAPKIGGARALEAALAGDSPDFLILFSSLAGTLGGFGQSDYSAANSFLDAFAEEYGDRHPETYCCAIAWGAWKELGMAAQDSVGELWRSLAEGGDHGIRTAAGVDALGRILSARPGPRVLVSPQDLDGLVRAYQQAASPDELLRKLQPAASGAVRHARPSLQVRFVRPGTELEKVLAEIWEEQLSLEEVGVLDNFFELGGTSLMGIQVVSEIRRKLAVEIPAVSLYEGSTVKALAALIDGLRGDSSEPEQEQEESRNRGALRRARSRTRRRSAGGER